MAAYHEEEGRMDADDRLAVETAAMRNDLEAYVLGLRGKINGYAISSSIRGGTD